MSEPPVDEGEHCGRSLIATRSHDHEKSCKGAKPALILNEGKIYPGLLKTLRSLVQTSVNKKHVNALQNNMNIIHKTCI